MNDNEIINVDNTEIVEEKKLELDINSHFSEEVLLLEKEILDTDSLYDELKTHFDAIKNSRNSGTLKFLADQAKSLIALRSHKTSVIKEKISVKKNLADLIMKRMSMNKDNGNGSMGDFKDLLDILYNKNTIKPEDTVIFSEDGFDYSEDDELLEQRINELMEDGSLTFEENDSEDENDEKNNDDEDIDVKIVVDLNGNKYVVDSEYNLLNDYDIPDFEIKYVEDDFDGETYAFDEDGNPLEIINIEE